jgi:hypothetical protein
VATGSDANGEFASPDIIQEPSSRAAVDAMTANPHKSLRLLLILKAWLLIFQICECAKVKLARSKPKNFYLPERPHEWR